jgi:RHS repeat-associated protein
LNNGSAFTHYIGYDNLEGEGRPRGIWDSTTSSYAWFPSTAYNAAGQPNQVQMVGGSTGSYEMFAYDPNSGRMAQWQSSNSGVNKSQTGTLTWNGNGTLQQLNVSDTYNPTDTQNCAYGYDDLARLASANCGTSNMNQNFSYDVWGNITKTVPTGSTGYSYNPTYDSHNHASSSTYDYAGNTTSDGSNGYIYNAKGSPVSVGSTQILYDAFNRAVEYNNGSSHTQVVYDPQGGKLAFMSSQTLQMYALPLAGGVQAVFNSSGLWYYRHSDWLGSTRLALDTGGNLYVARNYAPFGETYGGAGSGDNNRMFTGQTQDLIVGPTGVYDFLFRQHSTAQGRWLVPDPAGLAAVDLTNPQTWNRYAYVANNPNSYVDPLGLACKRGNRGAVQMGGCNMPGLSGGGGEVSIDGGSAIPIGLFGDGGSFGSGLGGGESAVPCLPGNCANTVADAAGNVFKDSYSNTLDLNCVGENLNNYQCSWSHWSRWFVYNGNQTYYYGGVQQLLNANADTWRNGSGAANTAAVATAVVSGAALAYEAGEAAADNLRFVGPSPGFAYGNGRAFGVLWGDFMLFRVDLQEMVPGQGPMWHAHLFPGDGGGHGFVIPLWSPKP